ncbi:MAG: DUF167 domain-containing protein [archaeon]
MEQIRIRVRTCAPKNEIAYDPEGGVYRVSVKAVPEKGKANKEIMKFLSKHFGKRAEIVRGLRSKEKVVCLQKL